MQNNDFYQYCIKQNNQYNCGPTCLVSIALFYGIIISIETTEKLSNTVRKGTNIEGLVKSAEKMNFIAKGVKGNLDCLDKIPLPAIAHIYITQNSKDLHYIVIYQVNNVTIEIMNPTFGKIEIMPLFEFNILWTGILILITPNF